MDTDAAEPLDYEDMVGVGGSHTNEMMRREERSEKLEQTCREELITPDRIISVKERDPNVCLMQTAGRGLQTAPQFKLEELRKPEPKVKAEEIEDLNLIKME
ncbi:uncharacterized protein Z518_02472 [Rhinocladiella mackenziei CBS 650.93]|uniref:Uncharacterized protein n=1 Tax=Rhinocladiella mackenziei CBS 650.93 TaxID=1442369 RepID=A0A0D2HBL0_9EURO|nr:uncharacterized protein Z518_02472 [Rhinocladiella mackenziei CBS 650.93]KIX07818.1 hypothetical protein Z518_02472 [Rhinocladiella mackenziei CBS 650.93]